MFTRGNAKRQRREAAEASPDSTYFPRLRGIELEPSVILSFMSAGNIAVFATTHPAARDVCLRGGMVERMVGARGRLVLTVVGG